MLSISPRLPLLLAIIAVLGMVSATAWQAYGFWQSEATASAAASNPVAADRQQSRQQVPDVSLSSISMFGNKDQTEGTIEEDIDNLPETNLQLVLRGVMSASGEFPGSALIEDSKRVTEAYVVGDELPGNATLRKVRPDRIIIERGGALENLYFPENEDRSGMNVAANSSRSGDDSEPDSAGQNARTDSYPEPEANQSSDARREEIRQRLEQLRNRLRNNN